MKIILPTIFILTVALLVNLFFTVFFFDISPLYYFSDTNNLPLNSENNATTLNQQINTWAIRGQIGDIMSGHFSALAFCAIAFSIFFQSEANKKMQSSINKQDESLIQQGKLILQQNDALEIQSKALNAQIEELKESRVENSKQTEEFFINNMNTKLDRYYKLLDVNAKKLSLDDMQKYKRAIIDMNNRMVGAEDIYNTIQVKIDHLNHNLTLIYNDINRLEKEYPQAYKIFILELQLRMHTDPIYKSIVEEYDKAKHFDVFKLLNKYIEI